MSEDKQIPNLNKSNNNTDNDRQNNKEIKLKNIQEEKIKSPILFEDTVKKTILNSNCHLLSANKQQSRNNGIVK